MKEREKYQKLIEYLKKLGGLAVAFSSGVDSTFLLMAAKEALGERAIAVTVRSAFFPKREFDEATDFCAEQGIGHYIVEINEAQIEGFRENPANRCYICKKALFENIKELAAKQGIDAVAEGSNVDDLGDYRPGLQAISELGILSPLREADLTKAEIRALSREMNLPTWKKQSYACLASRFVYGEYITKEKLAMVEAAEELLTELGFGQHRVRIHDRLARIEVMPEELEKLLSQADVITRRLKEYGFLYVTMDLQGYRTGSMNEALPELFS